MICPDALIKSMREKGYNIIRIPSSGHHPLDLVGRMNGATDTIASLSDLRSSSNPQLPHIESNISAVDIGNTRSSSVKFGIGIEILQIVLKALGGALGVEFGFTDARKMQFEAKNVLIDKARPVDVADFVKYCYYNQPNSLINKYLMEGELFIVTEILKSKTLSVKFEKEDGVNAKIDIPAIEQIISGNITIDTSAKSESVLTFSGETPVVFAFKCYALGFDGTGNWELQAVKDGSVPAAVADSPTEPQGVLLGEPGLLRLGRGAF